MLETRDDKGALFENLVIAAMLKRNLYARRPYNIYFWQTYRGYEIDLVLENVHNPEILAFQISTTGKASFSRAFDCYHPAEKIVVDQGNGYRFCW